MARRAGHYTKRAKTSKIAHVLMTVSSARYLIVKLVRVLHGAITFYPVTWKEQKKNKGKGGPVKRKEN